MKQLFVTLMILAVTTFGLRAEDKDKKSGPMFKFKSGEVHDFGTLKEGPPAEYNFEFVNNGNAPLIIQNASASCGCTVPQWPKEPILPGKKGTIKVTYTTQGHVSPFDKTVFIQSNAVNNPNGAERYELHIKGTVVASEDPAKKSNPAN